MARLLVNKHFTEHDKASQGFSNHEDYVFGEIIICNDSSNPSIYIKDADRNSVAIGNVRITNDDNLLSKTDSGEIKTTIGLSWDSQYNKIKLIGVNDTVISEINVFGDDTIGDSIDEYIDRIIDVNVIIPTELNHPAGTIIGKEYLEIIFSVNGNETVEYIPFVSSETLFTIEGGTSEAEGEVVAEFDKENNKYVISHGVVDVENNDGESEVGSFGNTKYITDINVNEFGHVTSINKSTLPEIPEHRIKKVGSESQAGYYVEDVLPTANDLEYEVKYKELPKPSITTGETITDSFTTTFVSNIVANGKDTHLTYELSEVNFNGYAKIGDLDKFVDEDELNAKLVNLGIINPDGEVPEVQVTIDDSEVLEGRYVYDIDVDDTDKTKLYIRTQDLGLDKFITKDSVVNNDDSVLAWGESVNIAEVGGNGISVTLPSKPGVSLSEEETVSENGYVVIDVQPINEGETNEIKIIKKELVLDGIVYDKNIDVPSNGTVLEWPNAENTNSVSVAKIGNKDIKIKLPSQPSIEVNDIENVSELTKVITDIQAQGHVLNVTKSDINLKDYVDKESVISEDKELPWKTKDAKGVVIPTKIAEIGGESINVIMPDEPVINYVSGSTTSLNPKVVTDIKVDGLKMTVNYEDAIPKDYVSIEELNNKHFLTANNVNVKNGSTDNNTKTFVKSITTGITDNELDITLSYGNIPEYDINDDITYTSTAQLKWGDEEGGKDGVSVVKIGDKDIKVKLPNDPKVNDVVNSKIVTYDIDSVLTDKKLNIKLTPTQNGIEGTPINTDADFSDFVKISEIPNVTVVDNGSGKFVTDVTSNGHSITLTRGDAMQDVDVESSSSTVLQWNTAVEIAKVDGKSIYAKLPVEPEKGEGADGNTLYTIEGGLTDKSLKITLTGTDKSTDEVTADFSDFVKASEIPNVTVVDNGSGKFVTDVTSNGHSITLTRENVDLGDYVKNADLKDYTFTQSQHYTPTQSASTKSSSNGQYISGIKIDDKNHIIDVVGTDLPTTATTADSAKALSSTISLGGETQPVYFKNGSPVVCKTFITGIYKTDVTTALGYTPLEGETYKGTVTDVKTIVGNSTSVSNAATTNGSTYLRTIVEGSDGVTSSVLIQGAQNIGVTSDSNGTITITGPNLSGYITSEDTVKNALNADKVNNLTVATAVPAGAVFTDTATSKDGHYNPGSTATTMSAGSGKYISSLSLDGKGHVTGTTAGNLPTFSESYKGTVTSVTVQGSDGLTGSGTVSSSGTITLSHDVVYSGTSLSAGSGKYISSLSLDGKGHVTGTTAGNLPTFSESYKGTVTSVTVQGSDGLTGSGTVSSSGTITLSHDVVYSGTSLSAENGKYISSLSLDGKGHVTGTTTKSLPTDTNYYHTPQFSTGLKIASGTGANDMYVPEATTTQAGAVILVDSWDGTSTSLIVPQKGVKNAINFAINQATELANNAYNSAVSAAETAANDAYTAALGALDEYAVKYTDLPITYGVELNDETKAISLSLYKSSTNQSNGRWTTSASTISPLTAAMTPKSARYYPVSVSYDGYLACYVPWSNTACTYDGHYAPSTDNSTSWVGGSPSTTSTLHLKGIQIDDKGHVITGESTRDNYVSSSELQPTSTTKNYLLGTDVTGTTDGTFAHKHKSVYTQGSTNGTVTLYATHFSGLTFSAYTGFYETSDERHKIFKDDIEVDFEKLKLVPKKYFTWKDEGNKKLEIGTSAQEIQKIYPEIVNSNTEGVLSVDYSKLSVIALKAIDVLHEENEKLRNELDEIKKHLGLK